MFTLRCVDCYSLFLMYWSYLSNWSSSFAVQHRKPPHFRKIYIYVIFCWLFWVRWVGSLVERDVEDRHRRRWVETTPTACAKTGEADGQEHLAGPHLAAGEWQHTPHRLQLLHGSPGPDPLLFVLYIIIILLWFFVIVRVIFCCYYYYCYASNYKHVKIEIK